VRLATKKGQSAFKFKSKSGSSQRNPKNRKWAMRKLAQDALPEAGLGADSTREAGMVCFRCGGKGHWAAECTQEAKKALNVIDLTWCVSDPAALAADAPPLPPVLRAEHAARLGLQGQAAAEPPPPAAAWHADPLLHILRDDFGLKDFRHFQRSVIECLLQVCTLPVRRA
jgi:Zinc knuckle